MKPIRTLKPLLIAAAIASVTSCAAYKSADTDEADYAQAESKPTAQPSGRVANEVAEREEMMISTDDDSADAPAAAQPAAPVATRAAGKEEKKRRMHRQSKRDQKMASRPAEALPMDPSPIAGELAGPPPAPDPEPMADGVGSEDYEDYGVNPMTQASQDRFSTFSIDVDTGSYTIGRKKLRAGQLPPASSVRVEEYVNYFGYHYPSPDDGAFGVHLEAAPSPFSAESDKYLMRVGVQGKRVSPAERKPVHLTFLVDVSGSMGAPDKLPLAKRAMKLLTNNLKEGDTVALATYAGRTAKILDPTGMGRRGQINRAIDRLGSGGGTGMSNGMELAYKMALSNHQRDHVNRVIVLSDGDANIGPMSHDQILDRIHHYVEEGVTLSTIGLGMGNYKDTMMEQLANKGNGNYYYIDDFKEAQKVFESQMDGTLQVIAKDVKIQVEFDPDAIPEYRLIGYENRDIADKDFRNDRVDAGEIGAGHTVTALYEVKLNKRASGRLATVRIRAKKPDGFTAAEQEFQFRDGDLRKRVADASKDFQFAASVAMFAEILRNSPYARDISLDLVEEVAKSATRRNQDDRREFLKLVRKAKRMRRG